MINYRTQASYPVEGEIQSLGDGYALVYRYGPRAPGAEEPPRTALTWTFPTGTTQRVPAADGDPVAIDGAGQVAWVTPTAIKVAKVHGAGTSKPRLLGVLGGASFTAGKTWKLDVDATKPLKAGSLEIRDAAGKLVRSISTTATASGSLRGVAWNGRDAKGRKVPAGTFTWTLKADAADRTGTLTSVTGLAAVSGTVKVKR